MLARIVYPVLVLAPGRLAHEFPAPEPNSTSEKLAIRANKVFARDSPPRAGGVGVAAHSRPRQMAVQQPYPGASR